MQSHLYQRAHLAAFFFIAVVLLFFNSCNTSKLGVVNENPGNPTEVAVTDWQYALKKSFREHYEIVVDHHFQKMHSAHPIIVQDLLNMTLIRPNGERIRFKMDNDVYLTLAHTSHTPLTIYSILYSSAFDINNDSTLTKLIAYSLLLKEAIAGIPKSTHLNPEQKERIITLMTLSDEYIKLILEKKNTSKQEYHDFAKSVRALIEGNLYEGAKEQLYQFREKLENWQAEYPEDRWDELRVAVLGFHQARDLYAIKLFFQWLLEEPSIEKRVIYAEFQFSIFGENGKMAEDLALDLLTRVDLEKEPSLFLMGDETILQQDVMGPAAEKILEGWGESNWSKKRN